MNKEFIKYVYRDAYKAPEAVMSLLREEGLTEKQISKCMRKRDKYLEKHFAYQCQSGGKDENNKYVRP